MMTYENALKRAEDKCSANGSKLTSKRKTVLLALLHSPKALSAYELVDYCRDALGERMQPMTIYRILEFLETEQLAHKLKLANRYVACLHITCNHDHAIPQFLICEKCYRVSEMSMQESRFRKLRANVEEAGFQLASPQLEINCVCQDCVNNMTAQ